MTRDFRDRSLIVDEDVAHYDGTTAVVRTRACAGARSRVPAVARGAVDEGAALSRRHSCTARVSSSGTVSRCSPTFTGSRLRSMLGSRERVAVFERFRASRRREREHLQLDAATAGDRSCRAA